MEHEALAEEDKKQRILGMRSLRGLPGEFGASPSATCFGAETSTSAATCRGGVDEEVITKKKKQRFELLCSNRLRCVSLESFRT